MFNGGGGAALGGAVFNMNGTAALINTTVAENQTNASSGLSGTGYGGGLFNLNGYVLIESSTFSLNQGNTGGSDVFTLGYDSHAPRVATTELSASIFDSIEGIPTSGAVSTEAPAATADGPNQATTDVYASTLTVLRDEAGPGVDTSEIVEQLDPLLGDLQNNGGPTATQAPSWDSPVIDARDDAAGVPATDGRGVTRPQDFTDIPNLADGSDLGAVELDTPGPEVQFTSGPAEGAEIQYRRPSFTWTISLPVKSVTCEFDGVNLPCAAATSPPADLADGAHFFAVTVIDFSRKRVTFFRRFTVTSPAQSTTGSATQPIRPPAPPTAPVLSSIRISPAAFAVAGRRHRTRGAPTGTVIQFALSADAPVRFTFQREVVGRKRGRTCRAVTKRNRRAAHCMRLTSVKGSVVAQAGRQLNRVTFKGRVAGRLLVPGRYRLTAIAGAPALTGAPRQAWFKIVP
jgi:hypothetical protein